MIKILHAYNYYWLLLLYVS